MFAAIIDNKAQAGRRQDMAVVRAMSAADNGKAINGKGGAIRWRPMG